MSYELFKQFKDMDRAAQADERVRLQDKANTRAFNDQEEQARIARQMYTPQGGDIPMDVAPVDPRTTMPSRGRPATGKPTEYVSSPDQLPNEMSKFLRQGTMPSAAPAAPATPSRAPLWSGEDPIAQQKFDPGQQRAPIGRAPSAGVPAATPRTFDQAKFESLMAQNNTRTPVKTPQGQYDARLSAQAPGGAAAFVNAIYGQESGGGKANTSGVNYAGARGPMQMVEGTFKGAVAMGLVPGLTPANANWADPAQNEAVGKAYAAYLFNKYGGDTQRAAAAYYTGEPNVDGGGNYMTYRDLKNPNAPNVAQYVQQVQSRMGGAAPQQAAQAPGQAPQQSAPQFANSFYSPQGQGMDQYRAQQLQQAMQFERDPAKINAMQSQLQEFQLRDFAGRAAQGDVQSISQLASAAGAALIRTPQGFAFVNPNTKEYLSPPMPAQQVAALLYQQVSSVHRAAAAASAAKIQEEQAKQMAQGDRELRTAGGTTAEIERLKGLLAIEQARAKPDMYQGSTDPNTGRPVASMNRSTGVWSTPQMADNTNLPS
jgi:hypothetical protein